jgi:hypothetical protein
MQPQAYSINFILLVIALLYSNAQAANEPPINLEVGRHYLDLLYAFDYLELEKTLHRDVIFEDPTAVAFTGKAWHITGRNAILDFFREASEGIVEGGFEVLSEFSTGAFVVFNIEYWSKFDGEVLGVPGKVVSMKIPGVTILQIRDGLVTHHTDHVDYDLLHKQVAMQGE